MTITASLTGADYEQAHNTIEDAIAPMLDQHSPDYVVGFLASFIAGQGLADQFAAIAAPHPVDLARLEREGEWT